MKLLSYMNPRFGLNSVAVWMAVCGTLAILDRDLVASRSSWPLAQSSGSPRSGPRRAGRQRGGIRAALLYLSRC
jgi:hypothetical protein